MNVRVISDICEPREIKMTLHGRATLDKLLKAMTKTFGIELREDMLYVLNNAIIDIRLSTKIRLNDGDRIIISPFVVGG